MRLQLPSQAHNLRTIRQSPLAEISGSLGDLGTLLPLLISLALNGSISLSTTLVFTGLSNILTGVFFGVPLPVQPMKAIAAVAISNSFTKPETSSAGLFVAAVVAFLSATGLLTWVGRAVPIPVIKGIQVGAGLTLVLNAGASQLLPLGWLRPSPADNRLVGLAAFLLLLVCTARPGQTAVPNIPFALIALLAGLAISLATATPHIRPFFHIWTPQTVHIDAHSFREGALTAGLGQIPLTTLNSIIAVTHLSAELLPDIAAPTPTALGLSVAAMNLLGCPFGAMPTCHGSGGLAAQYRFGARSGASIIVFGLLKLVLGLAVNDAWLVEMLRQFPKAILGITVVAAGVELAKVGESLNIGAKDLWERAEDGHDGGDGRARKLPGDEERRERWLVMMMTVAGLLAFRNDAVGFVAGLVTHAVVVLQTSSAAGPLSGGGEESLLQRVSALLGMRRRRRRGDEGGDESESLLGR